jgi:hypothetical protein
MAIAIPYINSGLNRDNSKSPHFTRDEVLPVLRAFSPPVRPFHIPTAGVWQAGGWYYFLWRGEVHGVQTDAIFCASHHDQTREKYYPVISWETDKKPLLQDVVEAIGAHASGLESAMRRHGIVTKRGFVKGKMEIWSTDHLEITYDHSLPDTLFATHWTGNKLRKDGVRRLRWVPRPVRGFDIPIVRQPDEDYRRAATITVTNTFHGFLTQAWNNRTVMDGIDSRSHRVAAHMHDVGRKLLTRYGSPEGGAAKGVDAMWEVLGTIEGGFTFISGVKSALGTGTDIYNIIRGQPLQRVVYGGCPNPKDPIVADLSVDSTYIPPFDHFFRRGKIDEINKGRWITEPHFGTPGLTPAYETISDLATSELLWLCRPNRGTEAILYTKKDMTWTENRADTIDAVRFYRADGIVVTHTMGRGWIYYNPAHHVYKEGPPLSDALTQVLMENRKSGHVIEVTNLLHGLAGTTTRSLESLNEMFEDQYGSLFSIRRSAERRDRRTARSPDGAALN